MTDPIKPNPETYVVLPGRFPSDSVRMPTHTNYVFVQNYGPEIFVEFALDDPSTQIQANEDGAKEVQVVPLGRFVMSTSCALVLFEVLTKTLESMGAFQRTQEQPTEAES